MGIPSGYRVIDLSAMAGLFAAMRQVISART